MNQRMPVFVFIISRWSVHGVHFTRHWLHILLGAYIIGVRRWWILTGFDDGGVVWTFKVELVSDWTFWIFSKIEVKIWLSFCCCCCCVCVCVLCMCMRACVCVVCARVCRACVVRKCVWERGGGQTICITNTRMRAHTHTHTIIHTQRHESDAEVCTVIYIFILQKAFFRKESKQSHDCRLRTLSLAQICCRNWLQKTRFSSNMLLEPSSKDSV